MMKRLPARRRRWLLRLLSGLLGLLIGLGVAEIALRWLDVGYPLLYQPDPYCGSRLRPGTRGVWIHEGRGHVAINSLGFRGPEITLAKPPDTRRLVVLGDSFIEALQVDYGDSLCGQLAAGLTAADLGYSGPPRQAIEVVNAGVSGYGTAQQLLLLEHYVLPLQPDVVLLAIYPENDIRNNHPLLEDDPRLPYYSLDDRGELHVDTSFRASQGYVVASSRYERWKAAWINASRVLQLLHHARQQWSAPQTQASAGTIFEQLCAAVDEAAYVYAPPQNPTTNAAWQVTQRLVAEIGNRCRAAGVRLIVFSVSTSAQVYPDPGLRQRLAQACAVDDWFYAEQRLGDFCARSAIEFVPLASQLQARADRTGEFLHGFRNTQLGLGHWSPAGHRAAAEVLLEYITARHDPQDYGAEHRVR